MCGIVGVFGEPFDKLKEVFEELLWVDQLRGEHSTGVAFLNNNYMQVVKDDVTPDELFFYKKYRKAMGKKHVGLIGHNRFATKGAINTANAHPFMHGSIVLAHNGTLTSWYALPGHGKFETDSECLAHSINEIGLEETWKKVEHNFNLGTMVWWNAKEKTLNMFTNGKRPMSFSWTKDKAGIVFASEGWMYRGITDRKEVELWRNPREACMFILEDDTHYAFKLENKEVVYTSKKLEKPKYVANQSHWYGRQSEAPFQNHSQNTNTTRTESHSHGSVIGPVANPSVLAKFKEKLGGLAKGITLNEFQNDYEFCVGCDASLFDEYTTCYVLDTHRKHALCSDCVTGFITTGMEFENRLMRM